MSPGQIVIFVMGTIVIIFSAYYVTYYVGIKSTNLRRGAGRSIVLRDRFSISKDKSFCLVEIYGKIYVIGVTNQTMTLLDTLEAESISEYEALKERQISVNRGAQGIVTKKVSSLLAMLITRKQAGDAAEGAVSETFAERLRKAAGEEGYKNGKTGEKDQLKADGRNPEEKE